MKFELTDIEEMDPKLQQLVSKEQRGIKTPQTISSDAGFVSVVARVSDLDAWMNLTEIVQASHIGNSDDGTESIVTGRVPVKLITEIREKHFVRSLKPGVKLKPTLAATVEEIRASQSIIEPLIQGSAPGAGVVVGIIDYGCDFVHKNFRLADGTSRIMAIWDQTGPSNHESPFGYGCVYSREQINLALQSQNPYSALAYEPGPNSHGTHVMDIAAGNGIGTGVPGVAPGAEIIFVQIATDDIAWSGPDVVDTSFGDSVQLLEAAKFIFDKAGDKPCVINFSLGTNGGPHDGSRLAEQGLDSLLSFKNRAIVIAASNAYADNIHAQGRVSSGGYTDITWQVGALDPTENEIEVWYSGQDEFEAELIGPDNSSVAKTKLGENGLLKDDAGKVALFFSHRKHDPNNGDNLVDIFMEQGLPTGLWTLRLHGVTVSNGFFHAWVERDDNGQSSFVAPLDKGFTLGSISTGRKTIVVGSYDGHRTTKPLSYFSSAGPTRDGREKPEISAPGHEVWAAASRSLNGSVKKSGTSMAAPAVAGAIAIVYAEAHSQGLKLSNKDVRDLVVQTARQTSPGNSWDSRYGNGRLDAEAMLQRLSVQVPVN
ncbi:MAG: peptidase S8 [Cyanobacteria bacterium DS3.002]|jgi:subtilisin family serine protease|nr:peptidase S8 [Cyanobacteria bacterium DS3.002]